MQAIAIAFEITKQVNTVSGLGEQGKGQNATGEIQEKFFHG
jgi:hypothetical protein